MNPKCTHCELTYLKEPGYFLGAMVASYFIGGALIIPTLVCLLLIWPTPIETVLAAGALQTLCLHPLLYRYSRLIWLHVETRLTQKLN